MIISSAQITAFKSIQKLEVPLDQKITVLIGPNESGKTNILKAIEYFRPDMDLSADLTCQFSSFYDDSKPPHIALKLTDFSRKEAAKLASIHEDLRSVESIIIKREGQQITDYKIEVNNKLISIPNIRPILKMMPKIIYFDSIPIIKDRINLNSLLQNDNRFRTENNLLKIGGIDDPAIIFEDSTRGRRAAEETSRTITQRIREVWTQEPTLEIKLRVNGKLLYIDFSDATTVYDTPKSRSPGFLWYLSFFINFIATTNEAEANEFLFLIDEPGSHLHPSGQKDLTQLLENLAIKNQLIYTTHSPFMVNRNHPERVRVVVKDINGTQVNSEAYKDNWRPLRKSIGLTVSDLFFFNSSGLYLEIPYKRSFLFRKKKKQPKNRAARSD